jgi:hypothetical protein
MFLPIAISVEAGVWLGWLSTKIGSRKRRQAILIEGTRASTAIPVIDAKLQRETSSASSAQRNTAAGITRGIRYLTGTRAFELAILKMIQSKWPGAKQEEVEVKLHL